MKKVFNANGLCKDKVKELFPDASDDLIDIVISKYEDSLIDMMLQGKEVNTKLGKVSIIKRNVNKMLSDKGYTYKVRVEISDSLMKKSENTFDKYIRKLE